jgi:DNA-binding transcriptional LysR family regulator
MRSDNWGNLAMFAAIAETGSFTRAAHRLGVSPSALSHAMRALEARLKIRLLNRTTRSVAPTEAGEELLARLRPAFADVEGALAALEARRERPSGRVRVSAHRTAALQAILPRLPAFAAAYPDVAVEVVVQDGLVDIVKERFDAGVRLDGVLDADMISVRISDPFRVVYAASPAYLARAGVPEAPGDLVGHRCLNYRYTSSGALHRWRFERREESLVLEPPATFLSNDVDLLMEAAVAGLGVASLSVPQAASRLASGALVEVLAGWAPFVPANYLYYPGRRHVGTALRAFVEAMRQG